MATLQKQSRGSDQESLAVFGGTFDPVHKGHLAMAEEVVCCRAADRVLFIPAAYPPHKAPAGLTSFHHRYAMLELALAGKSQFLLSDIELHFLPNPSYTITTMTAIARQYPDRRIMLLIGSDSLMQLHSWHRAADIVQDWPLLIYPRPGFPVDPHVLEMHWGHLWKECLSSAILPLPVHDISSTQIREKRKKNENLDSYLTKEVIDYIEQQGLFLQ